MPQCEMGKFYPTIGQKKWIIGDYYSILAYARTISLDARNMISIYWAEQNVVAESTATASKYLEK